jgi:hypothetical protein
MRNKKSKTILYAIAVAIILGFVFIASRDFTPGARTIEQPLENDFSSQ